MPIDAAVDARPDLVRGRWYQTSTVGTPIDEGDDLSILTVQALVPMEGEPGGLVARTGVGRPDGTFEIEGVPPATRYLLKFNRGYYVTDQHEIAIQDVSPMRGDQHVAEQSTPVTFEITSLPVTEAGDSIDLASVQLWIDGPYATPAAGRTTLSVAAEWMGAPLVEADHGDDLMIAQRRSSPATATIPAIQSIVASGMLTAPDIVDGQPTRFTAALVAPTARFAVDTGLSQSAFEAGHSPIANQVSMSFRCAAVGASRHPWGAMGSYLSGVTIMSAVQSGWPANMNMRIVGDFPDPFPTSLARLCAQQYVRKRPFRAPGATSAASLAGGSYRIRALDLLPIRPLAPPSAIEIDGQNAQDGGVLRNDGNPIELTWSGVSQATQYLVVIQQITRSGAGTLTRVAATITTDEPHVTIPALVLSGSEFIAFQITAISSSNPYGAGELQGWGLTGASATAVTAMFRYSATCGNGTIDLGEDCDGASASCDVDCTAAMCGDGLRNAAAGEICDSIEDTIGCDADCTPNVCGDGHLNPNTEQCDDAGTMSGDGCSATCRTE